MVAEKSLAEFRDVSNRERLLLYRNSAIEIRHLEETILIKNTSSLKMRNNLPYLEIITKENIKINFVEAESSNKKYLKLAMGNKDRALYLFTANSKPILIRYDSNALVPESVKQKILPTARIAIKASNNYIVLRDELLYDIIKTNSNISEKVADLDTIISQEVVGYLKIKGRIK